MVYRGGKQSVKAQEQEGWMTNNRLQHKSAEGEYVDFLRVDCFISFLCSSHFLGISFWGGIDRGTRHGCGIHSTVRENLRQTQISDLCV